MTWLISDCLDVEMDCGDGECVSLVYRCDGVQDCSTTGADEMDCPM